MKKLTPLLTACVVLPMVLPLQGCLLAAAAGAGAAYLYSSSEKADVEATPQQVIAAAEAVMADMDLTIESSEASALDGVLIAHTAADEKVKVSVSSEEEGLSTVTVRVGLADEAAANRILDKIRARL